MEFDVNALSLSNKIIMYYYERIAAQYGEQEARKKIIHFSF